MKAKIIPPDKMHLIDEFHSAQKAESEIAAKLKDLRTGGIGVSEELLEAGIAAHRRTIEALIAIQNLP
jgi:hypothetical protein